jgi:hypothetical protein
MQSRLTLRQETEAAPMLPGEMPALTLWVVSLGLLVPPELLARTIPLADDQEDPACR